MPDPRCQWSKMRLRFFLWQGLGRYAQLAADRLGNGTIRHAFLRDRVVGFSPRAAFEGKAVNARCIQVMNGRP